MFALTRHAGIWARGVGPGMRHASGTSGTSGERFSAFTWLGQGLTDTVTPQGRLRPNLHRLEEKDWILFDGSANGWQKDSACRLLQKKQDVFTSPERSKHLYNTSGSLAAQTEVLEMLLEYLPRRYPDHFCVVADCTSTSSKASGSNFGPETQVAVSADGWHAQYRLGDFSECPLELASRITLEDLVLVKDGVVCAGSVLFSFSRFHEKFGLNMDEIHEKVPQYKRDLQKPVNRLFSSLSPDRPMRRTNWNISWSDDIMSGYSRYPHRNPGLSAEERAVCLKDLNAAISCNGLAKSAWLKAEYQTLRRLPINSSCLLFTIRTFLSSFAGLRHEPAAARSLMANLNQLKGRDFSKYLGIDDAGIFDQLHAFLEDASRAA